MPMNLLHRKLCSSKTWAEKVERQLLPWSLDGVHLGDRALEIGPGYGANLRVLAELVPSLTALEISEELLDGLRRDFPDRAEFVHGDGASMPLPDNEFSSVVCFTMLHHVPTPEQQDALFAEARRVLRPGGVFAGSDGVHGLAFRLIHLGDTYNPIPVATLPDRLHAAGFTDIEVTTRAANLRWRAVAPA
ncbi:class I SAM-dependent methyltransferase [Amycolatopsis nigrescens]|uniref:class I SAM-dependent methyltransferase n=1 Tax=Amycolatopsis nigrescens TaxID=381445 RepID=UPI0003629BB8|nr:class I SAM-dependent methyltransferase [Amycolatopsis nigrescens]